MEGGWEEEEEEEEEEGMEEIKATLAAGKRALGSLPGGAALGVEGKEKEKEKESCSSFPSSSLESMLKVCDGLSALQLEAMGNKAGKKRSSTTTTSTGGTGSSP